MWEALRLAECAKYPGISCLPSRGHTDVTLLKEDDEDSVEMEDEDEDREDIKATDLAGVSLNAVVTTIHQIKRHFPKRFRHQILSVTKPAHEPPKQVS